MFVAIDSNQPTPSAGEPEIPLPKALADGVRALARGRLGRDSSLLFVGPRGSAAPADTVRNWWREAVDAVLVPQSPALAGITPHSMRHAGMTYWFAHGDEDSGSSPLSIIEIPHLRAAAGCC